MEKIDVEFSGSQEVYSFEYINKDKTYEGTATIGRTVVGGEEVISFTEIEFFDKEPTRGVVEQIKEKVLEKIRRK